jgi:hypothetical protein
MHHPSFRRRSLLLAALAAGALWLTSLGTAFAAPPPENLGLGLRELVQASISAQTPRESALTHEQFAALLAAFPAAVADGKDRVLVEVYPNGRLPLARAVQRCGTLGGEVVAQLDWYRSGLISAWIPLQKVARLAAFKGVSAVQLSPKPANNIGITTSQGAAVVHSDVVNNLDNILGNLITVGVLSDSYNKNATAKTTAAQDVQSGDLPGVGNPNGYLTPVNVVQEDPNAGATDEGRAMLQIVHDIAPASALAFATGIGGTANFANNILALAAPTYASFGGRRGANCQVVCDDLVYFTEPMFSDGAIAQAVDYAATNFNTTYFSSAGNDGNSGYIGTFSGQANNAVSQALLLAEGGIDYDSIPAAEQALIGQFHSFDNSGANPILVQKVLIPTGGAASGTLDFQWDDPSDRLTNNLESVTTDFDLLVFRLNGAVATYSNALSLTANNFATNQPIEYTGIPMPAGTQYEFVIVRTNRAPPNPAVMANQASHLRWTIRTNSQQIIADYVTASSPNSFGHTQALNCNSTAAYQYDQALYTYDSPYVPAIEAASSNGNATIYFDAAGNRLQTPETRKQPTLSAPDGVDNTFFGTDADGDGFPNFFGTSAASPHAAGCAALLLNAAMNKGGFLLPADVRAYLVNTTQGSSDQNPGISQATLTKAGVPAATASVSFTELDHSLLKDPYSLNVTFTGLAGQELTSLTINLAAGLAFIPSTYPFTAGPATGTPPTFTTTPANPADFRTVVRLNFMNFFPGDTLAFGVARYIQSGMTTTYRPTTKTDLLAGTTLSATITGPNAGAYTGTLANTTSRKWNYKSGFGLIDINAAINALP